MPHQQQQLHHSSSKRRGTHRSPVHLRVYDISSGQAALWSQLVLRRKIEGIWHTGVHVFGLEYFYGGGIDCMPSPQVEASFNMEIVEVRLLGYTTKTREEFERYLVCLDNKFTPDTYDLIEWNCNHFSDACARFLLHNRGVPEDILNLPQTVASTYLGSIVLKLFKRMTQGRNPATFSPDDPAHPRHQFFPPGAALPAKTYRHRRPRVTFAPKPTMRRSPTHPLELDDDEDDAELSIVSSLTDSDSSIRTRRRNRRRATALGLASPRFQDQRKLPVEDVRRRPSPDARGRSSRRVMSVGGRVQQRNAAARVPSASFRTTTSKEPNDSSTSACASAVGNGSSKRNAAAVPVIPRLQLPTPSSRRAPRDDSQPSKALVFNVGRALMSDEDVRDPRPRRRAPNPPLPRKIPPLRCRHVNADVALSPRPTTRDLRARYVFPNTARN